jgi:hypothetical protein
MSAIKQFLKHSREVAKKMDLWEKELIERMNNPVPIEEIYSCEEEFKDFDYLLRRNWFVNEDDILDLVWDASEEVFAKIMENVYTYPEPVRSVLIVHFANPKVSKDTTIKIKDLSDYDMYKSFQKRNEDIQFKLEVAWRKYKKDNGMTRPHGEFDDKYEELEEKLQDVKKLIEAEKNKPSKTYVLPSKRNKVKPVNDDLEKKVRSIENEIELVKKQIEQEEKNWEHGKKSEFSFQLWNKMFDV